MLQFGHRWFKVSGEPFKSERGDQQGGQALELTVQQAEQLGLIMICFSSNAIICF